MKVFGCFMFQILGKLYAVLSDKEQRAVYDEQGVVDEECDTLSQDRCWEEYWRLLFPKVLEILSSNFFTHYFHIILCFLTIHLDVCADYTAGHP